MAGQWMNQPEGIASHGLLMACRWPGFVTGGSVLKHGVADHGLGWDGWMGVTVHCVRARVNQIELLTANLWFLQLLTTYSCEAC